MSVLLGAVEAQEKSALGWPIIGDINRAASESYGKCNIRMRKLSGGGEQWWIDKRGNNVVSANSPEGLLGLIGSNSPPVPAKDGRHYSLTSMQAMAILGLSRTSCSYMANIRKLPCLRVFSESGAKRGRLLFDRNEILEWAEKNPVTPRPERRHRRTRAEMESRARTAARKSPSTPKGQGVEKSFGGISTGTERRLATYIAVLQAVTCDKRDPGVVRGLFIDKAINDTLDIVGAKP